MPPRILCLALLVYSSAYSAAKRPLTHDDFNSWRSIASPTLSRDGQFLAYGLFPQEGDGEVVIRNLPTGKEYRENAGALPPPAPPDPNSEEPPRPQGVRVVFTADSRYVVLETFAKKADVDRLKKEQQPALAGRPPAGANAPKGDMVVLDLASGAAARIPHVKSFGLPEKGSAFLVYLKDTPKPEKPAFGTDLVLRHLADAAERTFPDVLEYSLTKNGQSLVYSVASKKEETDGVYLVPTSTGAPQSLLTGKGKYEKLTWNDKQDALAFVSDREEAAAKRAAFKLYVWNAGTGKVADVASSASNGLRPGFVISNRAPLAFSKNDAHLFFGTMPAPDENVASSEEPVAVDLWHWKDDHIQPMQKVRAAAERARSYRAVFHLSTGKVVQLADKSLEEVVPSESGNYALGNDDREYRPIREYAERLSDSYLVDTITGSRKLISRKHQGSITWSPDSRYAIAFDGRDWNTTSVLSAKAVNLTAKLPVKFWYEDNDTPGTPRPYGMAGWTTDGKYVLLYDRYDIWQVAPDGGSASNLTDGAGRKGHLEFRYTKLDPGEKSIDPAKPLLLRAEDTMTRDSGFYVDRIDSPDLPRKVLMAPKNYGIAAKAKEADVYVLTGQSFQEFPDLLVTDASMKDLRKVTDANPQQTGYLWGTAEMVNFKNLDGVPLQGVLYKPENFDPARKYPMLVYIYERLSQNFNHFVDPKPMDSINISYYVSNGYLVFTPDIVYTIGYPGQSALKCVLGGVDAVVARGFVDEKAIGMQGHSWGGYQIAYMITQTNRFHAVEAGAVVANMVSAYDGIRWGPGLPRQFQYEVTQSRIGGTLWQYPLRFIENSPIFMADRVQTPLLMIHNDADDAVPWYQGIEYYLALRRLGKEVYMFTYNGEPHHVRKRENQKHYARRMQEYFDFYLKGAEKPGWMEHGIPYRDRSPKPLVSDQ